MFQSPGAEQQLQQQLQQAGGQLAAAGSPAASAAAAAAAAAASNKRNPFCSRCRNHGKKAPVKGHKRHCEYRDCQCEGCYLVEQRQKISAAQIKRRRDQKQDEESGRQIKISPPVLIKSVSGGRLRPLEPAALEPSPRAAFNQSQHPHLNMSLGLNRTSPDEQHQAAALSNVALQTLAKFPNCMLSTINHHKHLHQHRQQQHSPVTPTPSERASSAPALAELKPADQINLVERIHDEFGPLVVFAWLRAESFNAYKLLNLIELARGPFDELLQQNGHSPLDLTNPIVD